MNNLISDLQTLPHANDNNSKHATTLQSQISDTPQTNIIRKRRSGTNIDTIVNDNNANNIIIAFQQRLFENYHAVAYAIIIGTVIF